MKTLPEILDKFEIIDTSHLYHHEHDADELTHAIAKELMGCLPEKRELPPINSEWQEGWMWRDGGATDYNQAIDEVRARLTAFIGEEKKTNEN